MIILLFFIIPLCGCTGLDTATESKANTALAEGQLSGAEDVPYNILVSDPGKYSGKIIHITGKISSISAGDSGYNILVSTDKEDTGDYEGDEYSVLMDFNSASVSLGEIVDIKGEFMGISKSFGLPEITSLSYGLVYSQLEHLRIIDQIKGESKAPSEDISAGDLPANVSGDKTAITSTELLNSSDINGNTDDSFSGYIPDSGESSGISAIGSLASSGACQPLYHAGMVIADRDDNLKIITVCNTVTGKYCTRSLLRGNEGCAYLTKDSSFMELGSQYDLFSSIEDKYPVLYDDLSINEGDFEYNYLDKVGSRIYIRVKENNNLKGYLEPDSDETMKHVIIQDE